MKRQTDPGKIQRSEKSGRSLHRSGSYWKQKYAALQIQTPNEGMNTLINTWTLYQSEINVMFEGR